MAIYTKTNTFSANTLIQSAQVNANYDEISTAINTTLFSGTGDSLIPTKGGTGIATYTTGDVLYASATNVLSKLAAGTNGQVLTQGASIPSWVTAETVNSSKALSNLGLAITASGGVITVALKQSDASSDPSSGSGAVKIGFRGATAATGSYAMRSITAANSLTLAGATTLGVTSGTASIVYIYAVDNGGTITLGASLNIYDEGTVQSTSTTTTSNAVLYQASALSNKPVRLIGRFKATNTTNSWGSPTEVSVVPFSTNPAVACSIYNATASLTTSYTIVTFSTKSSDPYNMYSTSTGLTTVPQAGRYRVSGRYTIQTSANIYIGIGINGATVTSEGFRDQTGGPTSTIHISDTFSLALGDTIGIYAKLSTGTSALSTLTNYVHGLSIERVGD